MEELVYLSSENLLKADVVCDTLKIARDFKGGDHDQVLRDVRNLKKKLKKTKNDKISLCKIEESEYFNERGRKYKKYTLNFNAYSLLVMGYTGQNAIEFKLEYISAFNKLLKQNEMLKEEYNISKEIRKDFTDTIKFLIPEASNWTYSNLTRLTYKVALGKYPSDIREEKGIKKTENVKLYLNKEEINKLEKIEIKFEALIESGKTYKEIKEIYIKD